MMTRNPKELHVLIRNAMIRLSLFWFPHSYLIPRLAGPQRRGVWLHAPLYHTLPNQPDGTIDLADDDERYGQSLEFSWDELRAAMVARGFEIEREGWRSCTYTANARSMMKTDYECIFFTARKPL